MTFDLSAETFAERAAPGRVVPLEAELDVDVAPLDAYAALRGDHSFLLESADTDVSAFGELNGGSGGGAVAARYSFVGFEPAAVVTVDERHVDVEALRPDGVPTAVTDAAGPLDDEDDALDGLRRVTAGVEPVGGRDDDGAGDRDRQTFRGGLVGALAYDAVGDLWLREVRDIDGFGDGDVPEATFLLSTRHLTVDHEDGTVSLIATPMLDGDDEPRARYEELATMVDRVESTLRTAVTADGGTEPASSQASTSGEFRVLDELAGDRESYEEAVAAGKEHVVDGDVYQVVLSRHREMTVEGDPLAFYRALRAINPSPYMYLLDLDGLHVAGSSPETLLSVSGDTVRTNPIAGTCPRGATAVEDRRLAGEMLSDEKELAEHVMLVDLGRNDVRRVSRSGSIDVEDFMSVVQYSHVQHIESTVAGRLRDGEDAFDATRAIFPAGTLSGAPKIRAMEIIDALEETPRGIYGGGVGYFSWGGDADLAIAIRTATFRDEPTSGAIAGADGGGGRGGDPASDRGDGGPRRTMRVRAGAGIVADSVPEREFDETEQKMDALLQAVDEISADADDPDPGADDGGTER